LSTLTNYTFMILINFTMKCSNHQSLQLIEGFEVIFLYKQHF